MRPWLKYVAGHLALAAVKMSTVRTTQCLLLPMLTVAKRALDAEVLLSSMEVTGGGDQIRQSAALTMQYSVTFGVGACTILTCSRTHATQQVTFFTGTAMNDLQIAVVSLLSGDRYNMAPFSDWPILAASPREFWGRRYNLLISGLLHRSVSIL